jgi:hypothetical protein
MPAFCVEFKGPEHGSISTARAQAAYDGAVIVQAAWDIHKHLGRPAKQFLGQTKALVVVMVGLVLELYACHALPDENWDKT